jgi:hypothetical protein
MNCDIDVLRTLIGGWQLDFGRAGALIRPAALAMIAAYLGNGYDVVLPQMLVRNTELARFKNAAEQAGAEYRHCVLFDTREASVARFHRHVVVDVHHERVRAVVAAEGGDAALARMHEALEVLTVEISGTVVVDSVEATSTRPTAPSSKPWKSLPESSERPLTRSIVVYGWKDMLILWAQRLPPNDSVREVKSNTCSYIFLLPVVETLLRSRLARWTPRRSMHGVQSCPGWTGPSATPSGLSRSGHWKR